MSFCDHPSRRTHRFGCMFGHMLLLSGALVLAACSTSSGRGGAIAGHTSVGNSALAPGVLSTSYLYDEQQKAQKRNVQGPAVKGATTSPQHPWDGGH